MGNGISQRLLRNAYLCLAVALFFIIFQNSARSATHISAQKGVEAVPGELLVKLKNASTGQRLQSQVLSQLNERFGSQAVSSIMPLKTDPSLNVIRLSDPAVMQMAQAELAKMDEVLYSEPNIILRALQSSPPAPLLPGEPNDPDFGRTYGLHNVGQADSVGQVGVAGSDINVLPLWRDGYTGSRNIVVSVIDTGIDWDHPDLVDNLYRNANEIADNGVDDDQNGFIDDIHGWNFVGDNKNSNDDNNHGTHCAGTIGGTGNNALGVAGVNWQVSMLPVKFLSATGGGTLADAVDAINYSTLMNVNVMSNSWGGGGFMQSMHDAIVNARNHGILFVAAAGNASANNDQSAAYPANYAVDNVLAVSATDNQDNIASFSSYGSTKVHVAAPGVKVYSTINGGGYDSYSGTSMATPHVAGAAALLKSIFPAWTYADIKQKLIETSDPVPGLRRKVVAKGRINLHNAMTGFIPPSNEPDESLWQDEAQTLESVHPYANNQVYDFTIQVPGARYIRLHFERIDTEVNYDTVKIYDASGVLTESLTGVHSNYMSDYVAGESLTVKLTTDYSETDWGFKVDRIQVIR